MSRALIVYPRSSSSAAFCGQSAETMDDDVVSHRHRTKGKRTSPFVAAAAAAVAVTRDWEGRRRVKDLNSFFLIARRPSAGLLRTYRKNDDDGWLFNRAPAHLHICAHL